MSQQASNKHTISDAVFAASALKRQDMQVMSGLLDAQQHAFDAQQAALSIDPAWRDALPKAVAINTAAPDFIGAGWWRAGDPGGTKVFAGRIATVALFVNPQAGSRITLHGTDMLKALHPRDMMITIDSVPITLTKAKKSLFSKSWLLSGCLMDTPLLHRPYATLTIAAPTSAQNKAITAPDGGHVKTAYALGDIRIDAA